MRPVVVVFLGRRRGPGLYELSQRTIAPRVSPLFQDRFLRLSADYVWTSYVFCAPRVVIYRLKIGIVLLEASSEPPIFFTFVCLAFFFLIRQERMIHNIYQSLRCRSKHLRVKLLQKFLINVRCSMNFAAI